MRSKWIRKPPWSTIAIEIGRGAGLSDFRYSRGGDPLGVLEVNRRAKGGAGAVLEPAPRRKASTRQARSATFLGMTILP
jgi:hypothetical protein